MEEEIKREEPLADTAAPQSAQSGEEKADAPAPQRHWYVIHTATGYENKVQADLERKVKSMDLADQIFNIVVPIVEESVTKDGKKRLVKRKLFPGYVLVEMILNGFSWYVVRNTPGVTRFVGPDGTKPSPLTPQETDSIFKAMGAPPRETFDIAYSVGEGVRIVSGPYERYTGTVTAIDREKGRVTIATQIMDGKDATLELDAADVTAL